MRILIVMCLLFFIECFQVQNTETSTSLVVYSRNNQTLYEFEKFYINRMPSPHIIKLSKKELEDPLVLEDRILSEVSPGTILRIESVQLLSPEELYILSPYLNIKSVSKYYDINGAVSFKDVHFLMLWERKDEDVNKVFQMRHHLVYHRVSKIVNLDEYLPENF